MENHYNCIYLYTNKINGKKYVGQAKNFNKRHKGHIRSAYNEKCKAYNYTFHKAIRRHGIENFIVEILKENLPNQEELNYWEKFYITEFDTLANNRKGYNIASGGEGGNTYIGKTDEEMKEICRKHKGKNNGMYGVHRYGENNPMYGKNHSEETRQKISKATKGEKNPMYGVHRYGENNPRARKIVSVDPLTKQIVFTWQYKQQATKFYGTGHTALDAYLKGKRKTGHEYNGFLWYYLDEWNN